MVPEVVLVHDWIGGVHGAEQVLRELATLFPRAPILTLFSDTTVLPALGIDPARVRQSYLGRIPNAVALRKVLLPWLADAVQTLDVGDAALIVSSSHAVAKSVPHRSYQRHLAYVYSPMRYAHDLMPVSRRRPPPPAAVDSGCFGTSPSGMWRWPTGLTATWASAGGRRADLADLSAPCRRAASAVDVDAMPVGSGPRGDYYVAISRLVAYKRIDLAIRAAALAGGGS